MLLLVRKKEENQAHLKKWLKTKITRSTAGLIPGGAIFVGLVIIGLATVFWISLPAQNISVEQPVNSSPEEVPAVSELKVLNVGLTSLTLDWIWAQNHVEPTTYQIYQGTALLATVPESIHTYNVTGLTADTWYQFNVKACNASNNCGNGPVVGVNTLTVQQATESIIDEVNDLASRGVLNQKQGNDLIEELASIYQLDIDNAGTVIDNLQAFINDVNSLINAGVLSPEAGRPLIDAIKDVIKNIPE